MREFQRNRGISAFVSGARPSFTYVKCPQGENGSRRLGRRKWLTALGSSIALMLGLMPAGCGADEPRVEGMGGSPGTGGDASGEFISKFMLGADISSVPEALDLGASYVDTDGEEKPILQILGDHGFNSIRLRTFVDPMAAYGYAYGDGGACRKAKSYCDLAHTLEFAKQIKAARMGFLLNFHYSDNWADPGKQIIPEAWRDAQSIEELAAFLKDYTKEAIETLVEGGARPDVVQIGNEITPGMLIHVPTSQTDCWGNDSARNALGGSTSNWGHLATLLRAGIEGVKEVDPTIQIMLHLENTESPAGVTEWVENAQDLDVRFDILGLSCYPAYQGEPAGWKATFTELAERFPQLSFVVAEFGPEARSVIEMLSELPDNRGVGAFHWEPTQSGTWGGAMFLPTGDVYFAQEEPFSTYDALVREFDL